MRLLCNLEYASPRVVQMCTTSGHDREAGFRAEIANMVASKTRELPVHLMHYCQAHDMGLKTGDCLISHVSAKDAPIRELRFKIQRVNTKRVTAITEPHTDLSKLPMPYLGNAVDWHFHSARIERA